MCFSFRFSKYRKDYYIDNYLMIDQFNWKVRYYFHGKPRMLRCFDQLLICRPLSTTMKIIRFELCIQPTRHRPSRTAGVVGSQSGK